MEVFALSRKTILSLDRNASVQTGRYQSRRDSSIMHLQDRVSMEDGYTIMSAFVYDGHMPRAIVEPHEFRHDYVYVG